MKDYYVAVRQKKLYLFSIRTVFSKITKSINPYDIARVGRIFILLNGALQASAPYELGYYNHSNDTVATIVGGNIGMSDQYQGIKLVGQVPGSESRNVLTSLQEIYALFTTSNSAHSTYRWNDPKTWPTTQLPTSINQPPTSGDH